MDIYKNENVNDRVKIDHLQNIKTNLPSLQVKFAVAYNLEYQEFQEIRFSEKMLNEI